MARAERSQQRVDGAYLYPASSTRSVQLPGSDMVVSVRHEKRERRELLDDDVASFWSRESLKQLLEHYPGGEHSFSLLQRRSEARDVRFGYWSIAPQRE